MPADPIESPTDATASLLQALRADAPPLARVDAAGMLSWCSAAFDRLWPMPMTGRRLDACLGSEALARLAAGGPWEHRVPAAGDAGDASWWRLCSRPQADGSQLLVAEPLDEVRALQERLELVQSFTHSGIFERDPRTLRGRWDEHMFRVWGLPVDSSGAAPDHAATGRLMVEGERPNFAEHDLSRPGPHERRMRIRRPDGQLRHLRARFHVQFDAQGQARRILGVNTDDTEVWTLARRAADLSDQLQVALAVSRIGFWSMRLADGRVFLDERGSEIVGVPYRPEGLTTAEARARIHPDDVPQAEVSLQRTLSTGQPTDMQLRYPAPGGGWRHVMLRRALQRDDEGLPSGFIGVLLDVTERVEEQRRAQAIARRLETAAEAVRVGLWTTRAGAAMTEWNVRMFDLFGLDPREGVPLLPAWLERCVHPEERQRVRSAMLDWWYQGQGAQDFEFRIVRPSDGQVRWVVVRGRIDHEGPEGTRYAEGVAMDVTEQHEAMQRLHETVQRVELSARALGLGTWSSDPAGVVHWDEQMFRLRGSPSAARQMSPQDVGSFLHPDDRDRIIRAQMDRAASGRPWRDEFRVRWPDGTERWITSHSVPVLAADGTPGGRIGVNWDSTDAHQAAQARREREVAVAQSHAKSMAMSRISHELRTPLNAMLGFTQLVRQAEGSGDAALRARWLAHVEDAGRHLLRLIDDVLELSSAEAGGLRVELVPTACDVLLDAAVPLVDGLAEARGVTIRRDTPAAADCAVLADPVRLRQVLVNLLSNAVKYNRPGGEVRVGVRPGPAPGERMLVVADTGPGIAPERLRDVFEPFVRLDGDGTAAEGRGLGLAIAKVLVEAMGGRIEALSTPGAGSEFRVHLPVADATAAATAAASATSTAQTATVATATAAASSPATPTAARHRVLYIEDNPVNALLVREMLAFRPAVAVTIAVTGAEGIAAARALQPDLVLVDMQLPDMDGAQVLATLRSDTHTAGLRCVALSANALAADVRAALEQGFSAYWTKPIELKAFLAGIDAMLANG